MPIAEWCEICLKSGHCYFYGVGDNPPHPPHDEDEVAPLRSDADWTRIAAMIAEAERIDHDTPLAYLAASKERFDAAIEKVKPHITEMMQAYTDSLEGLEAHADWGPEALQQVAMALLQDWNRRLLALFNDPSMGEGELTAEDAMASLAMMMDMGYDPMEDVEQ